jgi:hypothetical protein
MSNDPTETRFRVPLLELMIATAVFAAALAPWLIAARSPHSDFTVLIILFEPFALPVLVALFLNRWLRPDVWSEASIGNRAGQLGCASLLISMTFYVIAFIMFMMSISASETH